MIAAIAERPWWPAVKRGCAGACPACGRGRMFGRYLKVNDLCAVCDTPLHEHRADDAPPYMTILVVGHVVGGLMLWFETLNDGAPVWLHMLVWPALALILCLWLLPVFKGGLIAHQWAMRMHGFGNQEERPT